MAAKPPLKNNNRVDIPLLAPALKLVEYYLTIQDDLTAI